MGNNSLIFEPFFLVNTKIMSILTYHLPLNLYEPAKVTDICFKLNILDKIKRQGPTGDPTWARYRRRAFLQLGIH